MNIKVFKVIKTIATVMIGVGTIANMIVGGKIESFERNEQLAKLLEKKGE